MESNEYENYSGATKKKNSGGYIWRLRTAWSFNPDSVYGAGFRKVKEYYDQNGIDMTIKKMKTRK